MAGAPPARCREGGHHQGPGWAAAMDALAGHAKDSRPCHPALPATRAGKRQLYPAAAAPTARVSLPAVAGQPSHFFRSYLQ